MIMFRLGHMLRLPAAGRKIKLLHRSLQVFSCDGSNVYGRIFVHCDTPKLLFRSASSTVQETHSIVKSISPDVKRTLESLKDARDQECVLDLFKKGSTTTFEISLILRKLTDLYGDTLNGEPSPVVRHDSFQEMIKQIDRQAVNLQQKTLTTCLKSLLELYQSADPPVIKSLYTQLQWLIRKMPVSQLFSIYDTFSGAQTTPLSQEIHTVAHENLLRRWVEITEPRHIVSLMYSVGSADERQLANLETRALDLCEKMNVKELYRVLYVLTKHRRRNTPLIRSVVYHMKKQPLTLNAVHLRNLGFACSTLNIFDGALLERWTSNILEHIKESKIDKTAAISIIQSIGLLRWRHEQLLDELAPLVLGSSHDFQELVTILRTCSVVSYYPEILRKHLPSISEDMPCDNPELVLEVIWSTAILGLLEDVQPLVSMVLNSEFINNLKESSESSLNSSYLKLANINNSAKLCLPHLDGLYLPEDFHTKYDLKVAVPKKRPLVDRIVAAFSQMAPGDKYFKQDTFHPSGNLIDLMFFVDPRGQIIPFDSGNGQNQYRVAVKILDFSDMTLGSVRPIGRYSMFLDQLAREGFKVFTIPFYEYTALDTNVKQVQYLQKKIKSCLTD